MSGFDVADLLHPQLPRARPFALSSVGGDHDLAHLFGGETGDDVDKFIDVEWRPGRDGCPVLARCDWFAGSIIERVDNGDHVAFLLAPHDGECKRSGTRQLGMQEIGDIEAGHPIPES